MLSTEEASHLVERHLGDGPRARHSAFVGFLMQRFAKALGEDHTLWEVTGLCHDLDFEVTADDRSRHGLITAEWLKDVLPAVALLAIQSHDHRAGIVSATKLADALKLADAVAVGELEVGRTAMLEALGAAASNDQLEVLLSARPYLAKLIAGPAENLSIPLATVAEICRTAPQQ